MSTLLTVLSLFFLFATSSIIAIRAAILKLGSMATKDEFQHYPNFYFFYVWIHKHFHRERWAGLFHYLTLTSQITRLCYASLAVFVALEHSFLPVNEYLSHHNSYLTILSIFIFIAIIAVIAIITDLLFKILGTTLPYFTIKLFTPHVTLILLSLSWITYVLLSIERQFAAKPLIEHEEEPSEEKIKRKLQEFLQEPETEQLLGPSDQKLLLSFASFRDRITKEIMVPRINIFALSSDETIEECIAEFIEEGYSRVPVYQGNIDNITGILLYKDLLKFLFNHKDDPSKDYLKVTIDTLVSPALFAPESKKISQLLQDFKAQQSHLAIIVDEYGGTEGIVTIEDILEELVGEIADEYDLEEQSLFMRLSSGSWIVDAKMSIIDIEKELNISIPEAPEYETIGGYIFHTAGAIPTKGWCMHHEHFDLEVISSTDRSIDKIKISPVIQTTRHKKE
ncbi:MAG: HlyC/CorC family transporter [Chlamydiales bacterium]|nr:HlyC/CorC family transporter [Chlamydiales bacterium]